MQGAIPLHFQMPSFCLNGVSAEEQKVKQKWAFSTFHTAERRQHRPPLRGGQCAKAQSEWRQVSGVRVGGKLNGGTSGCVAVEVRAISMAQWQQCCWHAASSGRSSQQASGWREERCIAWKCENIESCRLQFTVAFSV